MQPSHEKSSLFIYSEQGTFLVSNRLNKYVDQCLNSIRIDGVTGTLATKYRNLMIGRISIITCSAST
jgi:hypothetical protein